MMSSHSYGSRSPRSHYDVILIMTPFATELVTPTVMDERPYATDTLPRLIHKDTQQPQLSLSKHTSYNANTSPIYLNIHKCDVFDNGNFREFWGLAGEFLTFKTGIPVALHGTLVVGVSQTLCRWTEGTTYRSIRQGGSQY